MTPPNASEKIPNGAAWAAILAGGIGCAATGLFTDLAEGSRFVSGLLNFYKPVGSLSGKTIVGILVWLIAWAILHVRWRNRDLSAGTRITVITVILVLLALLATFPLFFGLFAVA
jgi:hypothetical protein